MSTTIAIYTAALTAPTGGGRVLGDLLVSAELAPSESNQVTEFNSSDITRPMVVVITPGENIYFLVGEEPVATNPTRRDKLLAGARAVLQIKRDQQVAILKAS